MAIYNYIALKNAKDIVKGKVEATDLREARDSIRKLGFIPTKVYEEKSKEEENAEKENCWSNYGGMFACVQRCGRRTRVRQTRGSAARRIGLCVRRRGVCNVV